MAGVDDCKASYRLRACWFDDIADFDDAERADLMGALIDYHFGSAHEFSTRAAAVAWRNISRTWQKDESHDSGLRDVRAEAGRRGAQARWQAQQPAHNAFGGGFSGVEDDGGDDDIRGAEYPPKGSDSGVDGGADFGDGDGDDFDKNVVSSPAENGKPMAKNGKRIFCHSAPMAKNGYKDISIKKENTPLSPPVGQNGKSKKGYAKGCGGITPPQESAPIADARGSSGITPSQGVADISPATDGEAHSGFAQDAPVSGDGSDAGTACADSPAVEDALNTGDGIPPPPLRPSKNRRTRGVNVADFSPPTLAAWQSHAEKIGWKAGNRAKTLAEIAAAFYYWQKLGWRTGSRPIVDWRAACADAKLRADSKANRVPAEALDAMLATGKPPKHWRFALTQIRNTDFDAFDALKWADYQATAKPDELREVLRRSLTIDNTQPLMQ